MVVYWVQDLWECHLQMDVHACDHWSSQAIFSSTLLSPISSLGTCFCFFRFKAGMGAKVSFLLETKSIFCKSHILMQNNSRFFGFQWSQITITQSQENQQSRCVLYDSTELDWWLSRVCIQRYRRVPHYPNKENPSKKFGLTEFWIKCACRETQWRLKSDFENTLGFPPFPIWTCSDKAWPNCVFEAKMAWALFLSTWQPSFCCRMTP